MATKLLFVLGTRPEAVKLGTLIKRAQRDSRFSVSICSTGQHREMIRPIFDFFGLVPDVDFGLMKPGQTLTDVTCAVLSQLRAYIQTDRPDWIIVQGDTTTTMAASLCAFYEKIKIAHVEAGLRTGDITSPFPEELNRRVTTLISDLHFAPTPLSAENLLRENVDGRQIHITGNTGIDALLEVAGLIRREPAIQESFSQHFEFLDARKKLILVTVHRRESFGEPMRNIMRALLKLSKRDDIELIVPLHMNPEVRKVAAEIFGRRARWASAHSRRGETKIWLIEPQDYLRFVYLMDRSHLIITDSGGVQEEAPSLGKPVLVVRESTERPEAVAAGTSKLVGSEAAGIVSAAGYLLDDPAEYARMSRAHNPFGDGFACEKILETIAAQEEIRGETATTSVVSKVAQLAANVMRPTAAAMLSLMLVLCTRTEAAKKVLPSPDGAYFGAYADFGATEDKVSGAAIEKFQIEAGKKIAWAYFSDHWINGEIRFPFENVAVCKRAGVIPYIRMSPWSEMEHNRQDPLISMQKIIDGGFDSPLRSWARSARESGTPIMIEFGPEVNGRWFPWNGKWNGGEISTRYGDPKIPDGPERFRDAYRHVIDLFREEGADDITWILHVDAAWSPEQSWNELRHYYPGDDYIDWIGVSVFGRQLPQNNWILFPKVLKSFLPQIERAAPSKPILISEFGVIEDRDIADRKAIWLRQALQSVSKGLFKNVRGVTYWNSPGWLASGRADFRITTSAETLATFRREIGQPFWLSDVQFVDSRMRQEPAGSTKPPRL